MILSTKKQRRGFYQTYSKPFSAIILMACMFTLMSVSLISAQEIKDADWTWDNKQTFVESDGEYGMYYIKDSFLGLWETDKVKDIKLESNTQDCPSGNCEAIKTITNYKETSLVDDVRFYELYNDGSKELTNINNYNFFIETGQTPYQADSYEIQCHQEISETNATSYEVCEKIKTGTYTEYISEWEPYELGTVMPIGTYKIKLAGSISSKGVYDWQILSSGTWSEEWAIWSVTSVVEQYTAGDVNAEISGSNWIAQGFSHNESFDCTQVAINGSTIGANGTFVMGIRLNNATNQPDGPDLCNGTIDTSAFADNRINITMNETSTTLDADTNYSLIFRRTSGAGIQSIQNVSGGYPNGFRYTSANAGGSWTNDPAADMIFIIYGSQNLITLNTPLNNAQNTSSDVAFNCTFQAPNGVTITNLTLYLNESGTFERNITEVIGGTLQTIIFNATDLAPASYLWGCEGCDDEGDCTLSDVNRTYIVANLLATNFTYNLTTFETKLETYFVNVSTNDDSLLTAATFNFNGTETTGTQLGDQWSATIDVPLRGNINKTYFWNFTYNALPILSLNQNVTINDTNFSICEGEGGNVAFMNFSFLNETVNQETTNATIESEWTYWLGSGVLNKTLSFANATENQNYSFCSTTAGQTLSATISLKYNNGISQQRIFINNALTLTNTTLHQVLFLLPSQLGIFTTFRTEDTVSNIINNVLGTITRNLGGTPITVATDLTDDSGVVVYFLNPDVTYTGSFSKIGFITNTFTFVPITDTRTVIMGSTTAIPINGTLISLNTSYQTFPLNGSLPNQTDQTFGFNVTSAEPIILISMNITNESGFQIGFQSNTGQGFISEIINTGNNTRIQGLFTIQTANETIQFSRVWIVGVEFVGDYSIFRQMTLFLDYNFRDFYRLLIVMAVIVGLMIFLTSGNITDTSESQIGVLVTLVWIFSMVGWLDNPLVVAETGVAEFSRQFGIAILTTAGGIFFILRRLLIRRI